MENMEQTVKKYLKIPSFRVEIKGSLECLYDKERQKNYLLDSDKYKHPYWDYLSYYVFGIYNDFDLDEYKESNIGELFYNEEEAKKVWEFCFWFYELTEQIGGDQPNESYLNHPEWHKVYGGAKEVFDLMEENDKKYGFGYCLREFHNTSIEEWFKKFEDK